jgi:hypothetical protein
VTSTLTVGVDRSRCRAPTHGRLTDYKHHRCRCPDARAAHTDHHRQWRHGLLEPGLLDALGARRRLQALVALGWDYRRLAKQVGSISRTTVAQIISGYLSTIRRATHDAIADTFERLSMTLGPSRLAAAAARNRGWATPLAWYDIDIDDPAAHPDAGAPPARDDIDWLAVRKVAYDQIQLRLTEAEQRAVIDLLLPDLELTLQDIAIRVGCKPSRVQKRAERRGIVRNRRQP